MQVNGARERTRGGLGVGLYLVRRLVDLHGGSVGVHSEGVGRGSELTVRLPARRGAPETADPPLAPPGEGKRVLVVDDNEDAANLLAELLGLAGCEVQVAYDGLTIPPRARLPCLDGGGPFGHP